MFYRVSCKILPWFSSCPRFSAWLEILFAYTSPTPHAPTPGISNFYKNPKGNLEPFLKIKFYEFYPTLWIWFWFEIYFAPQPHVPTPGIRNFSKNWHFSEREPGSISESKIPPSASSQHPFHRSFPWRCLTWSNSGDTVLCSGPMEAPLPREPETQTLSVFWKVVKTCNFFQTLEPDAKGAQ